MSRANPLQTSRPKRKVYTITLRSSDAESWVSSIGSAWDATYFLNLAAMMTLDEMARPYYMRYTFISSAADSNGTPHNNMPLQLYLDFGNQTFSHFIDYMNDKPAGILRWGVTENPNTFTLNAGLTDNDEVYIGSLMSVSNIRLSLYDITGGQVIPDSRYLCTITLTPADF